MEIRKGMWVIANKKTGIVANINPGAGVAEVHYVDAAGLTILVHAAVPLSTLLQAGLSDIPASRRPEAAVGALMGYL